jgi:hypothetical protein
VPGLLITIVIIYSKMDKVLMILGIHSFRAFHIKIAIGRLDPRPARICIRGEMPKRFNMIIKQAPIFISALDPMRSTGDIHRLNKVA